MTDVRVQKARELADKLRVQADGLDALAAATEAKTAKTTKHTPRLTAVLSRLQGHARKLRAMASELEGSVEEVSATRTDRPDLAQLSKLIVYQRPPSKLERELARFGDCEDDGLLPGEDSEGHVK